MILWLCSFRMNIGGEYNEEIDSVRKFKYGYVDRN